MATYVDPRILEAQRRRAAAARAPAGGQPPNPRDPSTPGHPLYHLYQAEATAAHGHGGPYQAPPIPPEATAVRNHGGYSTAAHGPGGPALAKKPTGGPAPGLGTSTVQMTPATPVTNTGSYTPPPQGPQGPAAGVNPVPNYGAAGPMNDRLQQLFEQFIQTSGGYDQARDYLGRAAGAVDQAGEFDPVNPSVSAMMERMAGGMGGSFSGPNVDRVALAENALRRFREARAPEFDRQVRSVGQAAAAFGRTGSGMTTNDLTDVLTQQQAAQRRFEGQVMDDALAGSVGDAIAAFNAGTQRMGVSGQNFASLAGIDARGREFAANNALARAGAYGDIGRGYMDVGGRERDDRATEIGIGSNLSNLFFDQEGRLRQESYGMERDAIQDRINEILLENQLSGQDFNQNLQWLQALGNMSGMDADVFAQIMGMLQ